MENATFATDDRNFTASFQNLRDALLKRATTLQSPEEHIAGASVSDNPELETQSLMERLRANPRDAFEEMVRLYQADVRILVRRHLGRTSTADEVAQQVFVAIYQSLTTFRAEGSLRAWVIGVTFNQIRSHIRTESKRRKKMQQVLEPELLESAQSTDDDPFAFEDAREDLNALKDCVSRLDERQREMIQAFYFRGQSADSIAERLGQNAGAVRMLLMRIRQRLGKCIRKKLTWQGDGHES